MNLRDYSVVGWAFGKFIGLMALVALSFGLPAKAQLLTAVNELQLEQWLGQGDQSFTKIFTKVAGDGQVGYDFHAAVDNKGPTFVLMSVYGSSLSYSSNIPSQIIGGYNPQSWDSSSTNHITVDDAERTAFIFNLSNGTLWRQKLSNEGVVGQTQTSLNSPAYGPHFGAGDLSLGPGTMESNGLTQNFVYGRGLQLNSQPLTYGGGADGHPAWDGFSVASFEVFTFSPIPEPSAYAVLFGGIVFGVVAFRRGTFFKGKSDA